MQKFTLPETKKISILALGAESSGNFSYFDGMHLYFSEDFGDLLLVENFSRYKKKLQSFLKNESSCPNIILSDMHPDFVTTALAQRLARKYKVEHIGVQHHHAHIFSAICDRIIHNTSYKIPATLIGIACDGTGYSEDGTVWGGEVFQISNSKFQIVHKTNGRELHIERIGHLEHQMLIGGVLAIQEPARIIISIIKKFRHTKVKNNKRLAYSLVKKYYSKNEFELLWNQSEQNFNCIQTSSTARILDAVSVLLGFCKNERLSKHGPIDLLEKNSTTHYADLEPIIESSEMYILNTVFLFEYLIKNLRKDKRRLAATAQKYLADGLLQIIKALHTGEVSESTFFSGGMANNKIISSILGKQGIYISKKIPRGDAGISVGQFFYYLLTNSGN